MRFMHTINRCEIKYSNNHVSKIIISTTSSNQNCNFPFSTDQNGIKSFIEIKRLNGQPMAVE